MKKIFQHLLILLAGLLVCAGCGSKHFSHEIAVVLEPGTDEKPVAGFKIGIGGGFHRESTSDIKLHSADSNGIVYLDHRVLETLWAWQKRPPYNSFALYIPDVSTNGYFHFRFDETSIVPTRGLKRGKIKIQPRFFEFDRPDGAGRLVPTISTEVMPSTNGGYHIKLHLPIQVLRDGTAAKIVPYGE